MLEQLVHPAEAARDRGAVDRGDRHQARLADGEQHLRDVDDESLRNGVSDPAFNLDNADSGLLAPLIKDRKTEGDRVFEGARRQGFVRVRVDGDMVDIADAPKLARQVRLEQDSSKRVDEFVDVTGAAG